MKILCRYKIKISNVFCRRTFFCIKNIIKARMKIKQSANKFFLKDLPKAAGKSLTIVRSPTAVQAGKPKKSLQGRINPNLPINQIIVNYTPDVVTNVDNSESEASGNESEKRVTSRRSSSWWKSQGRLKTFGLQSV